MNKKTGLDKVPQILSIVPVNTAGKVRLVKTVKEYLGLKPGQPLYLHLQEEVLLRVEPSQDGKLPVSKGNTLVLPEAVRRTLDITDKTQVGLVERSGAVAIKVVEINQVPANSARLVDNETPLKIVRQVETAPPPVEVISQLQAKYANLTLPHDVRSYITGRQTFMAWHTRQLLGCPDDADNAYLENMIESRLAQQAEDGSWSGSMPVTARNLREIAELGVDRDLPAVRHGADWLLNRAQSAYNPGMFLGSDALVAEQAQVMAQRQAQKRGHQTPLPAAQEVGTEPGNRRG